MRKLLCLVLAVGGLAALAAPALAAESPASRVIVEGRMLTDVGYWHRSSEITKSGDDVTTSFVNIPNHSYLRARWRTSDAMSGGRIELGIRGNSAIGKGDDVHLRYAYGWYKVGNCRIMAGKTDNWVSNLYYIPLQFLSLEKGHLLMMGWGYLYSGQKTQLQFQYETESWGAQLSFVEPSQGGYNALVGAAGIAGTTDLYYNVPRIDAALQFKAGGFMTNPGFSWTQWNTEGETGGADDSVHSWMFNLPASFSTGAFTVKAGLHYGVNASMGEWALMSPFGLPVYKANGDLEDTTNYGGFIWGQYKMGAVSVLGGVGVEYFENDEWKDTLGYQEDDYHRIGYFLAVPYQVNKYFGLWPEFGYYDYGDSPVNDSDLGTEWLLGIQFRFIF